MRSETSQSLSRREFLRACGGAVGAMAAAPLLASPLFAADRKPNIIFILADDLGWGDLGCYGHYAIKTPNLDRLAKQGMLFTNFYAAASVCSPSRAGFLTGQFPARLGVHNAISTPFTKEEIDAGQVEWLDPSHLTIPAALKAAGYATGHVGKWHLGAGSKAPDPSKYGFDWFKITNGNPPAWREAQEIKTDPYWRARSTSIFVDEAIGFIERNKDRPFYLDLWSLIPHATLNPTPEQMEPYKAYGPGSNVPYPGATTVYYSTVAELDKQVGRLLAKLDDLGLADNTIIVFSSDNGPEEITVTSASHSGVGSPGPFRGRKRSLYDGGTRMPFIVRWPGVTPAGRVNITSVVSAVDLMPTLLAAAGVKPPAHRDGENIADILRGSTRQRKEPIYWQWRFGIAGPSSNESPQLAIRDGDWKLLCNPDGSRIELYDLSKHGTEFDNVADRHPDVVKRLSSKLIGWSKSLPPGKIGAGVGKARYPWPG